MPTSVYRLNNAVLARRWKLYTGATGEGATPYVEYEKGKGIIIKYSFLK